MRSANSLDQIPSDSCYSAMQFAASIASFDPLLVGLEGQATVEPGANRCLGDSGMYILARSRCHPPHHAFAIMTVYGSTFHFRCKPKHAFVDIFSYLALVPRPIRSHYMEDAVGLNEIRCKAAFWTLYPLPYRSLPYTALSSG